MLRLTALYSGSKGNSYLIECGDSAILVDAGRSARAIMTALAAALFVRSPSTESLAALGGMAFFVASDSVLAVNVFKYESEPPVQSGIIMTTYIAAQSLLCAAFVLM